MPESVRAGATNVNAARQAVTVRAEGEIPVSKDWSIVLTSEYQMPASDYTYNLSDRYFDDEGNVTFTRTYSRSELTSGSFFAPIQSLTVGPSFKVSDGVSIRPYGGVSVYEKFSNTENRSLSASPKVGVGIQFTGKGIAKAISRFKGIFSK